jgi:tRNA G18 (ribose-2'-O)-methylase SpoU
MNNVTEIKDIQDPRIAPYRSLKMHHPEKDGLFIAESRPAVMSLLHSDMDIVSCLTTRDQYEKFSEQAAHIDNKNIQFYLMKKKDIEDVIGFKFHHGIMMAAKCPERRSVKDLSESWPSPHLLVVMNGIHDPQNVGLITRNAAAFGADTLIVDENTYEPYYRKVVRISMGSIFKLPVAHENNLVPVLNGLKNKCSTKIVVTSLEEGSVSLEEADLSGNLCLVFGNEASGASKALTDIADLKVRVPHIFSKVDSLNVACASSICLYQAYLRRQ